MIIHDKRVGGYISNLTGGLESVVPALVTMSILVFGYRAQKANGISAEAEFFE